MWDNERLGGHGTMTGIGRKKNVFIGTSSGTRRRIGENQ